MIPGFTNMNMNIIHKYSLQIYLNIQIYIQISYLQLWRFFHQINVYWTHLVRLHKIEAKLVKHVNNVFDRPGVAGAVL